MERSLRAGVVGFLCLVVLTSMGTKADDQCLDNHVCTFFHTMDFDDDNICSYLDFISEWLLLPLIGGKNGMTKDVQRQITIAERFMRQFPLADKYFDKSFENGGAKLNEYRETIKAKRYTPEFKTQIADLVRLDMKIFDYDGDETTFTLYEYQTFLGILLVSAENATTAFNKIDRNGDGRLSFDEYYSAACDYLITCLDERNAWFFGPPTTCEEVIKNVARSGNPVTVGPLKIPANPSAIGTIDILKLLYKYVPEFSYLTFVFNAIGVVPDAAGTVLGTAGGLLGK